MSQPSLDAQVTAARTYEALLVPALFGQWVAAVADAAEVKTGQRVLDVACGTGVLAREACRRTGATGYVAGLDPGSGMLAVARELSPSVDWRAGTAEALPFSAGTFDAVVSQFGLMFMDRVAALHEMLRVLKPDGRLVVAVWDTVQNMPAYAAELALLERRAGTRAADALRAPFVLGDRERLADAFKSAGAVSVSISTHRGVARFPGIRVMVEGDLRGWLPVMGVNLTEEEIGDILREADDVLAPYLTGDGRVAFDVQAHIVTARKPSTL
jgi:SAM-dependent methyltransferase